MRTGRKTLRSFRTGRKGKPPVSPVTVRKLTEEEMKKPSKSTHRPKSGGQDDPKGTPRKKRLQQSTVPKKPKKGY